MILILLSILFARVSSYTGYTISVYGDVYEKTDKDFFTRTFPWIIDNIGGDISVDFYMVGSGKYAIPQMCALQQLKKNTYLQSQYLKCEAEDNPSEYCLCETGIDRDVFRQCVAEGGNLTSEASRKFSQLRVERTPIIEIKPGSTVFGIEDGWFLKKICTIFGDDLPRGCIKPFVCEQIPCRDYDSKRAIAHFDRCCRKEWGACFDNQPVPVTTPYDTDTGELGFN